MEIDCPKSSKNRPFIDEETGIINFNYLKYENGEIILKLTHQYCIQCQILMLETEPDSCDLFIYIW